MIILFFFFHLCYLDNANAYCQVSFNNQKKVNKPRPNTLSPKWNDVFLFDIEDLQYPLKISLFEEGENLEAPGKDDLLGSVTVSLQDIQIDMSGEGNPNKAWYNIKRKPKRAGYKLTPKLRVEVSYILKSKLEETAGQDVKGLAGDDEEVPAVAAANGAGAGGAGAGDSQNGVFGIKRGKCKVDACDCDTYQPESARGGQCQNCGHWPAQHQNLGSDGGSDPGAQGSTNTASAATNTGSTDIHTSNESTGNQPMVSQSWEINSSELQIGKRLGEGTSAQVFRGTYRSQEVAIKILKDKAEAKVIEEFKKEFDIMRYVTKNTHTTKQPLLF